MPLLDLPLERLVLLGDYAPWSGKQVNRPTGQIQMQIAVDLITISRSMTMEIPNKIKKIKIMFMKTRMKTYAAVA